MKMTRNGVGARILVVDDDAVSRELLALLLAREGYEIETADSGDAALLLQLGSKPDVVLADIQMPGIAGAELARRLREVYGAGTVLLAMSGSMPDEAELREFDGFLRKPFTMDALAAAVAGNSADRRDDRHREVTTLDEEVYRKLAMAMPRARLKQLYELCLSDAEARMAKMRRAASEGDPASYKREAHAIKGGCGMVGAVELQSLATVMEESPLSNTNHVASLREFTTACERLRRILDERTSEEGANREPGEDAQ